METKPITKDRLRQIERKNKDYAMYFADRQLVISDLVAEVRRLREVLAQYERKLPYKELRRMIENTKEDTNG